jgi:hypothetical protein
MTQDINVPWCVCASGVGNRGFLSIWRRLPLKDVVGTAKAVHINSIELSSADAREEGMRGAFDEIYVYTVPHSGRDLDHLRPLSYGAFTIVPGEPTTVPLPADIADTGDTDLVVAWSVPVSQSRRVAVPDGQASAENVEPSTFSPFDACSTYYLTRNAGFSMVVHAVVRPALVYAGS